DVAMDQAGGVGVFQSQGRLADVVGGPANLHRASSLDDVLQAGAVHVFHDQKMQILILVDVVGMDNVGMIESRNGAGFAVKAKQGSLVRGLGSRQDFDGHAPA